MVWTWKLDNVQPRREIVMERGGKILSLKDGLKADAQLVAVQLLGVHSITAAQCDLIGSVDLCQPNLKVSIQFAKC